MSPHSESPVEEEARYLALQSLDPCTAGVLEILVVGLHDESWRVRHVAAEALKRMPASSELAARLISVLGERGETGARNAAAEALAGLGSVALGPLVDLLAHPDPDQRKFAADILGQLGQRDAEGPWCVRCRTRTSTCVFPRRRRWGALAARRPSPRWRRCWPSRSRCSACPPWKD
ncbi:HEAT repeat domain-containing protein [Myxococcus sp. MxC21-1]|nr:HEAT repeat domain-containing protein [Myxococcus sp. MxC21-1]WNZ59443.1 HEAT repeat domain-containing protein [Myxococcus sp. MxC21-1]